MLQIKVKRGKSDNWPNRIKNYIELLRNCKAKEKYLKILKIY